MGQDYQFYFYAKHLITKLKQFWHPQSPDFQI